MDPNLKIVVLITLFIYVLPFMTAICCFFPVCRHIFFVAMIYFTTNEKSISLLPMPRWSGTAKGYTFTAVSLFAVPLLCSMIFSFEHKVSFFPPGSFFYFLYWLAILLSGVNAIRMHQWGFEIYKMFWMYITFLAAFNYMNNSKNLVLFVYTICCVLILLFLFGLKQKYLGRGWQIHSTFPHQNSLSLYLEMYGLLALGVLMNERMGRLLFTLTLVASGGAVVLIILTYSRGGLVIYFGGIAIVCGLSILINGFSVRRLALMLIGMVVMLGIVGYALPRIIQRFTKAPEASKATRIHLALAAKRIADDYYLGIGANNFTEYSGVAKGYAKEQYDGVSQKYLNETSGRGGIVETIYLLVAAECGWWGLGTLLLWFLYYYFSVIISIISLRRMPCSGILIGVFGGLTCNYCHSTLEWSLKQPNNFAGQVIVYALIAVIALHRKSIKAAGKKIEARGDNKPKRKKWHPSVDTDLPGSTPVPQPVPALVSDPKQY